MSCNNKVPEEFELGNKGAISFAVAAYIMNDKGLRADYKKHFHEEIDNISRYGYMPPEIKSWWQNAVNITLDRCKITPID